MNKEKLDESLLNFIQSPDKFVCEVLFILNKDGEKTIKFADIQLEDQESLKLDFLETLNKKIVQSKDLKIEGISHFEERKNILFKYDYDEMPIGLELITTIKDKCEFEKFSFIEDKLEEIFGVVFVLAIKDFTLISYKQNYRINLYKRDSKAKGFIKSKERLVKIPEDIIKIYPTFDFFYLNDDLFIKSLGVLEKYFSFNEVITKKATESLALIEEADLLVDINLMKQRLTDLTFARKLAYIGKHSQVLKKLEMTEIIKFIDNFIPLQNKFKFNDDKSKFDLSTKVSQNYFLKLLNDDYLISELTDLYYESSRKDIVE